MKSEVNISVGRDEIGDFMQHQMNIGEQVTSATRHYYKIIDEQLLANMPQHILEDLVAKGVTELYNRAENNSSKHVWLGKALNSLLNGVK